MMLALPGPTVVTKPFWSTTATLGLLVDQVKLLEAKPAGMEKVSWAVMPSAPRVSLEALMFSFFGPFSTVTAQATSAPPSILA